MDFERNSVFGRMRFNQSQCPLHNRLDGLVPNLWWMVRTEGQKAFQECVEPIDFTGDHIDRYFGFSVALQAPREQPNGEANAVQRVPNLMSDPGDNSAHHAQSVFAP